MQGCDASLLLAGNEQNDPPNLTLGGFPVIDNIKAQVEAVCPQTVSCADILAVAARDSVVAANCPVANNTGTDVLAPLDTTTPNAFDNAYFNNLLNQKGLLHSDQELFNGGSTDNTVRNFASNPSAFTSAFATAVVEMGNISPLTGTQGQTRTTCSAANSS
ncbi:Peroxidase 66 [Dichanthelium oligosanthes]|uniref:Peroxidase 66 n=1 Tax=Dichanthelium oligosanthes TaxID=888268 RepID=A0A1E5WE37_9POAL|nr:Peroxidase 66 [Dichanthelium oligosanthes]